MNQIPTFDNEQLLSALQSANSFLLCTHVSPDGDALGSMLATRLLLQKMGKTVTMISDEIIPDQFTFLEGIDCILPSNAVKDQRFDVGFALDAGDRERLGECVVPYFHNTSVTLQLDHHKTNDDYAEHNVVDWHAGACACIVMRLIDRLGIDIDLKMAECLYVGISSDTGNFSFANADAEVFYDMSVLVGVGLPVADLARRLYRVRSKEHCGMLSCALSTLTFYEEGKLTFMKVYQKDFEKHNALPEHSDRIVNYGLDLHGVYMTAMAEEKNDHLTRFSLRAQPPCNVGAIALSLGGGGHNLAAGCSVHLPMEEACEKVLKAMQDAMRMTFSKIENKGE